MYVHVLAVGVVFNLIFGDHVTFTTSLNVTVTSILLHALYDQFAVLALTFVTYGAVLSIQLTVAVLLHVFHAVSVKLNTYDPFAVNVYTFVHAGC